MVLFGRERIGEFIGINSLFQPNKKRIEWNSGNGKNGISNPYFLQIGPSSIPLFLYSLFPGNNGIEELTFSKRWNWLISYTLPPSTKHVWNNKKQKPIPISTFPLILALFNMLPNEPDTIIVAQEVCTFWQLWFVSNIFSFFFIFFWDRERVCAPKDEAPDQNKEIEKRSADSVARTTISPPKTQHIERDNVSSSSQSITNSNSPRYLKSASISASKCVVVNGKKDPEVIYWIMFVIFLHVLTFLFAYN